MSSDFSTTRKVEDDLFACLNDYPPPANAMKREHDSTDDFEHLENEQSRHASDMKRLSDALLADVARNLEEDQDQDFLEENPQMGFERESPTLPATPPPSASSADFIKFEEKQNQDSKKDTLLSFMENEKISTEPNNKKNEMRFDDDDELSYLQPEKVAEVKIQEPTSDLLMMSSEMEFKKDFQDSPENRSTPDLMAADSPKFERYKSEKTYDDDWKDVEKEEKFDNKFGNKFDQEEDLCSFAPTKPLPPEPKEDLTAYKSVSDKYAFDKGDSEFESGSEPSPIKSSVKPKPVEKTQPAPPVVPKHRYDIDEIAPKDIFKHLKLDAWFNPERLNPKVAALIYWRDPKKSGIVFGAILVVLLSLAYFSLISVVAYLSLLTLTGTIFYRIYKTVLQAIQKTSDGHPFKDILELDLTLPAEKVHEFADVAVANANAAVRQLRRLFLVEDIVDSVKFASLLWIMTYVGAWFNGMTLVIIGVVALFTLPKVYETNKVQIDQNLALVQAKVNEITAKVKAAIPLGKKAEPQKEE